VDPREGRKSGPAEGKVSDQGPREGVDGTSGAEEKEVERKDASPGTAWRVGYYVPVRRGIP